MSGPFDDLATLRPKPDSGLKIRRATEIEFINREFWWGGRLPVGYATVLSGKGGIGKSTLTTMLAASVTTGAPFPGETTGRSPKEVFVVSYEDEGDIWTKRFIKHGGDQKRLIVEDSRNFRLRNLEAIAKYQPGFVIIDPVAVLVALETENMNSSESARNIMTPLENLATYLQAPILVVMHWNKNVDAAGSHRTAGSAGWVQASRSEIQFGELENGNRALIHEKHNYTAKQPPLEFSIDGNGLLFLGENPDIKGFKDERPKRDEGDGSMKCKMNAEWVVEQLRNAPMNKMSRNDLLTRWKAENRGSDKTLQRAIREAKDAGTVRHEKEGFGGAQWLALVNAPYSTRFVLTESAS